MATAATAPRRVLTGRGSVRLAVPRDLNGSFEPQFVAKR
ncbi:MAG: transposase [Bryobacterales bacterium]|nr:transposase [Bryobacterales bacterium]